MEDKLYFLIWEMIALGIVVILLTMSVRGIASNSSYWKKYYAVDVGLMADIENINQGDFVINYALKPQEDVPQNQVAFEFVLNKNRIEVYTAPKEDSRSSYTWPYAKAKTVMVADQSVISDFLVLSKIGTDFRLGTYEPKDLETCASFDTAKTIDKTTKIQSTALTSDVKGYAQSFTSIMGEYGSETTSTTVLSVLWYHAPKANFTITYSDDATRLRAEKLSCMLAKKYSQTNINSTVQTQVYAPSTLELSMTANTTFVKYLNDRALLAPDAREPWILITLDDDALKTDANTFAGIIKTEVLTYYGMK